MQYTAGSVLASEIVGGCARKLRAFVRRQSDSLASGTRNVVRRSSLASSAKDEEYIPKNFADKIRHVVVRKILKQTPNEKSTESGLKMTFTTIKRITMFRKRKSDIQENGSNGNVTTEKQPDAVETNFENSVGLTTTTSCFDLEKIAGDEDNKIDLDRASLASRLTANDRENAEMKQD